MTRTATGPAAYRAYVEWDVRNWSVAPQFWERHTHLDLRESLALELGSRHGGLSLWLARRGARVVCSDLNGPTERARRNHRAAGIAERVRYATVNAADLPYDSAFDVIVFKSVLGALDGPDRRAAQSHAVAGMHRALRPGGELFFAENLAASALHRFLRRRFVSWGQQWRYVSLDDMREFLSPFRDITYRTVGFSGAFGRNARQREILGALDRALLDRLVPEAWRYILIGVARK